jgi:hypothetical protein
MWSYWWVLVQGLVYLWKQVIWRWKLGHRGKMTHNDRDRYRCGTPGYARGLQKLEEAGHVLHWSFPRGSGPVEAFIETSGLQSPRRVVSVFKATHEVALHYTSQGKEYRHGSCCTFCPGLGHQLQEFDRSPCGFTWTSLGWAKLEAILLPG